MAKYSLVAGSKIVYWALMLMGWAAQANYATKRVESKRHMLWLKATEGPRNYSFYMHNTVFAPRLNNTNNFNSVYGPPPVNASWPIPHSYGVFATFEDPLTVGPTHNSQPMGTAQGFTLFDSLKQYTLFFVFTANITLGPYKGTIDIFGQVREDDPDCYLTVIGGTGDFLLARGLALCKLMSINHGNPGAPQWTLFFDLHLYY